MCLCSYGKIFYITVVELFTLVWQTCLHCYGRIVYIAIVKCFVALIELFTLLW